MSGSTYRRRAFVRRDLRKKQGGLYEDTVFGFEDDHVEYLN